MLFWSFKLYLDNKVANHGDDPVWGSPGQRQRTGQIALLRNI